MPDADRGVRGLPHRAERRRVRQMQRAHPVRARVLRKEATALSTVGELWLDRDPSPFCFTLEDVVRPAGVKVQDQTAIPAGLYALTVDWSNRFNRYMPHVVNVPMFTGIRIHSGNGPENTEGCILLGRLHPKGDWIEDCHGVFALFFDRLENDLKLNRECSIELINTFQQQAGTSPA
jgi:hypothetical protein